MSVLKNRLIGNSSLERKSSCTKRNRLTQEIIVHPSTIDLKPVRCPVCNHLLGFIRGVAQIKCHKCKHTHIEDNQSCTDNL